MRTRSLRRAFLAMVLVFPLLISAVAPRPLGRPPRGLRSGLPVLGSEMVLVGGLFLAGRGRRRLLARAVVARPGDGRPSSRSATPRSEA
jgi:hypothetical protein